MRISWRRQGHDPAAGLGDLEAALRDESCPICAKTADVDARWLDRFLDDGYLNRDLMRRVAADRGFCARHAPHIEGIGQSAIVALVYLSLIENCLPLLAERGGPGAQAPRFPAPDRCEACAHQRETERRECYFLALLVRARGPRCYGAPALVCLRHLPPFLEYVEQRTIGDILAVHRETVAALKPDAGADPVIRMILGPPQQPASPPDPVLDCEGSDIPDPVGRMSRRLRDLPFCAVCAEVMDACVEWLSWLARASEDGGKISDVLPLCRDHAWQARAIAGPALAPALAAVVLREADQRLAFAAEVAAVYSQSQHMLDRIGRAFVASPARRAVLASLRRGRECPLCVRIREAGERALSLVAALVENTGGRRAFESGYGLCVRHATRAMAMPDAAAFGDIVARTTQARLMVLRWELEEQLRRGAWQARPQRRGVESASWLRAGARFAGTI